MTKRIFSDPELQDHYDRIWQAAFDTYDLADVVRFIEEKTYLNGNRFSFKDHEFQRDIASDTHPDINVQKCAQVGMSELMARYVLGVCRIIPYFSAILTMPGANDSVNFFRTRIDPIINDSPELRDVMEPSLDNTEIKGIGTSLLYGRGTRGSTAALSVPADMLVHDELDRSDPHTIQQYQSRIKHSNWKLTRKFGTPTIPGTGIALAMAESHRLHHMVKCNHCNAQFVPSYHSHVHIPGYDRDKKEINAHNLMTLQWEKAALLCPKCGKEPSLQPEFREWVCENPLDNLSARGYYVTPFSVPNVVSFAQIVKESTKFTWPEFCNQTLGETSQETSATLTAEDVLACRYTQGQLAGGELHCMGVDLGSICHFTVGRMTLAGELLVVYRERCTVTQLRETRLRLMQNYRVLTSVFDWQPYTDTVLDLQKNDPNLYAALYSNAHTQGTATFTVKSAEENTREGKLPLTEVRLSRDLHFDELMNMFKQRKVVWQAQGEIDDALFVAQMTDMKRTLIFDKFNDGRYTWVKKPNDQDHYHHSVGYLYTACRLMPTATGDVSFYHVPVVHRIKIANRQETEVFGSVTSLTGLGRRG